MDQETFGSIVFVGVLGLCLWHLPMMLLDNWAADYIDHHWEYCKVMLERVGLGIAAVPGGFDDSPCEVVYSIYGKFVFISRRPFKTFLLLRRIKRGITYVELIGLSDTPSCKVPL